MGVRVGGGEGRGNDTQEVRSRGELGNMRQLHSQVQRQEASQAHRGAERATAAERESARARVRNYDNADTDRESVKERRSHSTTYSVALLNEQLGQVGAVLSSDARDKRDLSTLGLEGGNK